MVWLRLRKTCNELSKKKTKTTSKKVSDWCAHIISQIKSTWMGNKNPKFNLQNSENENSTTTAQIKAVNRNGASDLID